MVETFGCKWLSDGRRKTLCCCRAKDFIELEESVTFFYLFRRICNNQFPILTNVLDSRLYLSDLGLRCRASGFLLGLCGNFAQHLQAPESSFLFKFPSLNVRTTPKPLYEAIQNLSEEQKKCIEDMGFGNLLDMKMDGVVGRIAFAVIEKFDVESMEINFERKKIIVNEQSIHDMLGIPIGGVKLNGCKYLDDSQFNPKGVRPNEIKKKIIESEADFNFKVNFLTLMSNTLGECNLSGTCNLSLVNFINPDTVVSNINWCEYNSIRINEIN
ncbi:LOW QUALITY PROTEIN: hypothetical protein OSB04_009901 [Centaurea solstitialis]|uniref:Uncharacterized protein n=1 Tax=Centaurea solstitialis TaxID=347529 RepID=A0AA38WCB8_9ASTR|nr:LOW QUALITY PROTEIN: hypothetical protein OSB04_009901 [Centaurea solstitialis]